MQVFGSLTIQDLIQLIQTLPTSTRIKPLYVLEKKLLEEASLGRTVELRPANKTDFESFLKLEYKYQVELDESSKPTPTGYYNIPNHRAKAEQLKSMYKTELNKILLEIERLIKLYNLPYVYFPMQLRHLD